MTTATDNHLPVIPRLKAEAHERLAELLTLHSDFAAPSPATAAAIHACGLAIARYARTIQRLGQVRSALKAGSTWIREQRVLAATCYNDEVQYHPLPAGERGRRHEARCLREFNYGSTPLSAVLTNALRRSLSEPSWDDVGQHGMVPIEAMAAHHGVAESTLREWLRSKPKRHALGWPVHYGNGVWKIPRRVLADDEACITRQQRPEPPHIVPLPDDHES